MPDQTPQSFSNHTKWDPPFHFFIMPFTALSVLALIWRMWTVSHEGNTDAILKHIWLLLAGFAAVAIVFKVRLYSLKVQDRVIRLEETLRLTHLGVASAVISQITPKQFVALRFASDGEVVALAQRAVKENLEPKSIKEAIKEWRPDEFRV